MPEDLASQMFVAGPSVHPAILVLMFAAFLVGVIGPFALCVAGSIREERAMRRYAATGRAEAPAVANPVDPAIVPAAVTPELMTAVSIDHMAPANDHEREDAGGVPGSRLSAG